MNSNHAQKASLAGSLVSAFLASICCIGPVIFAILGVSGAAFVQKFERYRPAFLVISILFLGVSFFFAYRKKPANQCEAGSYCAHPSSGRINKIFLWVAVALILFFIFFPEIISKVIE